MKKIVISDIHGCNKTFLALLEKTGFGMGDKLFLLGDYIDRGADSKGVIDSILRLQSEGHSVSCIRGNHEQMLVKAWTNNDWMSINHWTRNGGKEALMSFGVTRPSEIPDIYKDFINELGHYIEEDNFLMVHAGLKFSQDKDPLADLHSLMWMRRWYGNMDYDWLGDRYVVHGHTPKSQSDILDMFGKLEDTRYMDIDAGCCFNRQGFNNLCALDISNREIYFQRNID